MKRKASKDKPTIILRTGDIKRDLSKDQLAGIGAAALIFNVLEDQIDEFLLTVTRMPIWLFPEISGRINGLEGKVAVIQAAIADLENFGELAFAKSDFNDLSNAIAEFMAFKRTRDVTMHARLVNVAAAIAQGRNQRGKSALEVVLSVEALEAYYGHALALEQVYRAGNDMLGAAVTYSELANSDPYKAQVLGLIEASATQFRNRLQYRRSLLPLPEFPSEAQIRQAVDRWHEAQQAELRGWMSQFQRPAKQAVIDPETGRIYVAEKSPPSGPVRK